MPVRTLMGHLGIPEGVSTEGLERGVWFSQDDLIAFDGDGSAASRANPANWGFGNLANDTRRKSIIFHASRISRFIPAEVFSIDLEHPWHINHGLTIPEADKIYGERALICKKFNNNQNRNRVRPVGLFGGLSGLDNEAQFGEPWKMKMRKLIELHDIHMVGVADHVEPVMYFDKATDKATFDYAAWMLSELNDAWPDSKIVPWLWWRKPDGSPVPMGSWKEIVNLTSHLRFRWVFGHNLATQAWEPADQARLDVLL